MNTRINGLNLEKKSKLYIDEDGQGRLLIPKMMIAGLKLKKGDMIRQTCKLDKQELVISANGRGATCG
jgi:hypothetical protein